MQEITEEYIKMCVEAEESLGGKLLSIGDRFAVRDIPNMGAFVVQYIVDTGERLQGYSLRDVGKTATNCEMADLSWIPTQEDLQVMIRGHFDFCSTITGEASALYNQTVKLTSSLGEYYKSFNCWDALWLGYVMYHKHNKAWDGEEWQPVVNLDDYV